MTLDKDDFRRSLGKVKPEPKKKKGQKTLTSLRLDPLTFKALKAVAEAEGVSQSQLTDLALELFLSSYAAEELDGLLRQRKETSNTPRWPWKLNTGLDISVLADLAERLELPELVTLL